MNKTKVHLDIIQETSPMPLWVRACQLQATEPIIVDPKSSEIIAAFPLWVTAGINYEFDNFTTAKSSHIGYLRGTILGSGYAPLNKQLRYT
ncbi:MAG: hypothetical protein V7L01_02510 [Nostoc sp.]|uniref:hypothetical protein n=1 Tax=Nostoc sp. TaxID=1180 RepID=UPI002FFC5D79